MTNHSGNPHGYRNWALLAAFALLALLLGATHLHVKANGGGVTRITGISDQNMVGWDDTANNVFNQINLPQVRYITAYDVVQHKYDNPCLTDCQRYYELTAWLAKAQSRGKRVLISFSDVPGCNGCAPPTPSQYAAGVGAFLLEIRTVTEFTAWNEPNHQNHVAPGYAAQYWKILNDDCRFLIGSCTVAAGDLIDAGNYRQYTLDYKAVLGNLGVSPSVWAIHPYGAVDSGGFSTVLDWINNSAYTNGKPVWFTEVGAFYCSTGGLKGATAAEALTYQNNRAGYLNSLLKQVPPQLQRTYYYFLAKPSGQQENCPEFDTALLGADDFPRPALTTLFGPTPPAPWRGVTLYGSSGQGQFSGYIINGYGNIEAFGGAPAASIGTPWPIWDIARSIVSLPGQAGGYLLDGYGGVHPFGGAPAVSMSAYWPNWDIARDLALCPNGSSGYVLDGYGGVHPFGGAPAVNMSAYWPNWDIARAIVVRPDCASGYVLDGYGGVHPFGTASAVSTSAYWPNWDIARDIALRGDGSSGYVLDGYGGIHSFGGAPPVDASAYWPNWDIAKSIAFYTPDASGGVVLDGQGGVHPFEIAPEFRTPTATSTPTATPTRTPTPTATATPVPNVDFSMGIDAGSPDHNPATDLCSTKAGGNTKCAFTLGSTFTLQVYLDSIGNLASYAGMDIHVTYSGVGSKGNPRTTQWPDCEISANLIEPGSALWGCVVGITSPPSTYTGGVGTLDFNCTGNGQINLVGGPLDTNIDGHGEPVGQESLTINCLTPTPTATDTPTRTPTPTPCPTATPGTPPPTPTPTATPGPACPKPLSNGPLSGVYDIEVNAGTVGAPDKNTGFFHCIARLDHDASTNEQKIAAQCIADWTAFVDPNSQLANINVPGEGPDGSPGPPPPPPYTAAKPTKGRGYYYPATDKAVSVTCFPNIGGALAPNISWVIDIQNAKAQLAATGKLQGAVYLYGNQSQSQCDNLTPSSAVPPYPLPIKLYKVGNGAFGDAPWRADGDDDYDNDGCTDFQELDKTGAFKCGDDPWNPYDSNTTDMSGTWYFLITARQADACAGGSWLGQNDVPQLYSCAGQADGTFVPGAYYHCYADIQQAVKALDSKILCYTDWGPNTNLHPIPGDAPGPGSPITVNPEQCAQAGLATGQGKNFSCTGDGRPHPAPPGKTGWGTPPISLFADIDSKHTHLMGTVDNSNNTFSLEGCFEDLDGRNPFGYVYASVTLDLHTWQGEIDVWWVTTTAADCTSGHTLNTGIHQMFPIEGVKQADKSANRDTDQDGCPDKNELSDSVGSGGLRDPANPWDHFNPANNAVNNSADITAVVNHYGHLASPPGDPLYNTKYDRGGAIPGSNPWNLRPPNGNINSADVTAAVNSYGHNCGTAINKTTPTPRPTATHVPPKSPPPPTKALPSFPLPTP